MKVLLAIDGNSLAYRSYFAFSKNPLINSKGLNVSAVFGFINSFKKALNKTKSNYVFCAFDKGSSGRTKVLKQYKSQRPKMSDDLSLNMLFIKQFLNYMGVRIVEVEGYEADDVIATIVRKFKEQFDKIYILTSDKDMFQLIDDKVFIYDGRANRIYDKEAVKQKFGVYPEQIPDYLVMVGDSVDNIPGIKGIGSKTAVRLLEKFGSLEGLKQKLHEVESSIRRKLQNIEEYIKMKTQLTALKEVKLNLNLDELKLNKPNKEKLFTFLIELELFSILKEFSQKAPPLDVEYNSRLIDLEITAYPFDGNLIYMKDGRIYMKNMDIMDYVRRIAAFESKELFKMNFKNCSFDLLLADYLIDPELSSRKSNEDPLEYIMLKYMGYEPPDDELQRSLYKVFTTYSLKDKLINRLKEMNMYELLVNLEIPVSKVLSDMERRGIRIDTNALNKLLSDVDEQLKTLQEQIYELAGTRFNLNSPKQLSDVLFKKLKLPPLKKTKTGYSTSYEVLVELSRMHELPAKILEYRELHKLKTSYIENLISFINERTGRIHPKFNQRGTATGRISCSHPNIQNIPKSETWGRKLRECFIADEGKVLIKADYSQIELRILAHLSDDEELLKAFSEDRDIHEETAKHIFKKEVISPSERRIAKAVNFGIIYGISPYGLSKQTGMDVENAKSMIEDYFKKYTKVRNWITSTIEFAKQNGYVRTLLGRIRRIPEFGINSTNRNIREAWERIAVNSPIQGSAADIIKLAMVKTAKFQPIMQIHDELVFEVDEDKAEMVAQEVKNIMENVVELKVPLKVDVSISKTWTL